MFLDGFFVVFLVVFLFLLAEKFLRQRGKINERRKSNVTVVLKVECSSYVLRKFGCRSRGVRYKNTVKVTGVPIKHAP